MALLGLPKFDLDTNVELNPAQPQEQSATAPKPQGQRTRLSRMGFPRPREGSELKAAENRLEFGRRDGRGRRAPYPTTASRA